MTDDHDTDIAVLKSEVATLKQENKDRKAEHKALVGRIITVMTTIIIGVVAAVLKGMGLW